MAAQRSHAARRRAWRWTALAALVPSLTWSASLDSNAQQLIRAATFEVVQLKPPDGAVTYDRPLPLDLIPYQQRIDKYRSIGTAFAIGPNRYVTASHVILLGSGSQFGPPALRDADGNVFAIERALAYSDHEDFVEFSLAKPPKDARALVVGPKPAINDTVYAVGNALGEGVVMRDGVYTSDTPEEQDGAWKWLRFSAAASPGNSGGPLVDQSGRVVGVVLRKSPSENLNYALSIDQVVSAKDGEGILSEHVPIRSVLLDASETLVVSERFALPKTLAEFYPLTQRITRDKIDQAMTQLLAHNAARLFPHGDGSQRLLHSVSRSVFPKIMHQGQDGNWAATGGQTQNFQLDHNGFVELSSGMFRLRTPDDVSLSALYGDSKLFMDLLLKGLSVRRMVGTESVKVTSLGKAKEDGRYVDAYGRAWRVMEWPIPYDDIVLTVFCLPTPQGYAGTYARIRTGVSEVVRREQQRLVDYAFVTMVGTLSEWQDYLKQKGVQPKIFDSLKLDIDPDHHVRYQSPRMKLDLTSELFALSKDSELMLDFAYLPSGDAAVWDVGAVALSQSRHDENWVYVSRLTIPPDSLPEGFASVWKKSGAREFPYNATSYNSNGRTDIETVVEPSRANGSPSLRYTLKFSGEGERSQDEMSKRLALLQQSFTVTEH